MPKSLMVTECRIHEKHFTFYSFFVGSTAKKKAVLCCKRALESLIILTIVVSFTLLLLYVSRPAKWTINVPLSNYTFYSEFISSISMNVSPKLNWQQLGLWPFMSFSSLGHIRPGNYGAFKPIWLLWKLLLLNKCEISNLHTKESVCFLEVKEIMEFLCKNPQPKSIFNTV